MPMLDPTDRSDLLDRGIAAQIAGCNCDTKSPELRWHAGDCRYRVLSEMDAIIRKLRGALNQIRILRTYSVSQSICIDESPDRLLKADEVYLIIDAALGSQSTSSGNDNA